MIIFNKIKFILLFAISITSLGCANNQNLINDNRFLIKNFTLDQLDPQGQMHFKMSSRKAYIDPRSRDIESEDIKLILYKNNIPNILIRSDGGNFINNKQLIELNKNIRLTDINKISNYNLSADKLIWDLYRKTITISGKVILNYNTSKLITNQIIFDEKEEKFFISGITDYKYYNKIKDRTILQMKADRAILDTKNNELIFESTDNRVKSILNIEL